jgi:hypothetical protein
MKQRFANTLLLVLTIAWASCATTQQLVIKADMAYSTAVFALDDAEWTVCHPVPPAAIADTCTILDVHLVKALQDVKAVTLAIKAAPTTVPTSLPALLTDLSSIQIELNAAAQIPAVTNLANRVAEANAKAIALLTQIAGK